MRAALLLGMTLASTSVLAEDDDGSMVVSVVAGQQIFSQTCVVCHGRDGKGAIPGVADLTAADGALLKSDEELTRSITEGFQSPGSALGMPPNGGNPTLTKADSEAVVIYLRSEFGKQVKPGDRRAGE